MTITRDPYSVLQLVELSHEWGHGVPSYPGQADVKMFRAVKHAQHGVLAWKINTSMHTGTHLNAPIHLIQKGADVNIQSKSGVTALMIASARNVAPMIGLLIQAGAKPDLKSVQGQTAADIAEQNGAEAAAKALKLIGKVQEGTSN